MKLERCPDNPIVTPGRLPWRRCVVFNPAVVRDDDGTFYMLERAAGTLRPFRSALGLLRSDDGVHFELVGDRPVFTSDELGYPRGGLQDPRVVKIGDTFHLVYVLRRVAGNYYPTGLGTPTSEWPAGWLEPGDRNCARSGIAVSKDMIHWRHLAYVGPEDLDDRDNVLFPEKIDGKYVMLRRPQGARGQPYRDGPPSIWLSTSQDLKTWSEPQLVAAPRQRWEGVKIGASAPPIATERGWLVTYHGVDAGTTYRMGAMLLDRRDPTRVLARTAEPILAPQAYYERFGLFIPNVVFPTGAVVVDGKLFVYYGVCDTAIALATVPLEKLLNALAAG